MIDAEMWDQIAEDLPTGQETLDQCAARLGFDDLDTSDGEDELLIRGVECCHGCDYYFESCEFHEDDEGNPRCNDCY